LVYDCHLKITLYVLWSSCVADSRFPTRYLPTLRILLSCFLQSQKIW
jgi:hypothetical protein